MKHSNLFGEEIIELKWEDLPDYGDLMTLQEFEDCVVNGAFIDYDGHGHYASQTQESDAIVYPSDLMGRGFDRNFTHVIWYNR